MDSTITYLAMIPLVFVFVGLLATKAISNGRAVVAVVLWLTALFLTAANPTSIYMFLVLLLVTASVLIQVLHSQGMLKSKYWSYFYTK